MVHERSGVIAELPRRQFLEVSAAESGLSRMRIVSFETSLIRSFRCLFSWVRLLVSFILQTAWDVLLGQDDPVRRARYLRHAFERQGGSFIKLGTHLSLRVDFMPWVYCTELSRMFDHMEPFPVRDAIAVIERSTKKPISATFARFDPEPVASTSVACTYQAMLHTGEKVMVKVRRPGIGRQFMADIQAFNWLLLIAEFFTIFRPGRTQGMRNEFRELLLDELDFVEEARRQDAFRRSAAKSRKDFFSAPRIHLDLSGEEVVVSEFAKGVWLWELIAAIERDNEAVLSRVRAMNINPRKVAKRLLWVNYWGWQENLFFHADPHPKNIIVGRNSRLYFINFSATGTLSRSKRQAMRQNLNWAWQRDPQNMARSALILLEPLPPVDVIELTQRLETYSRQLLYALEAVPENVPWPERTSAIQWMGIIQLARKYGIVIDKQVLRLLRSVLLFESMAVRLHPEINFVRQYRKFDRYRARQARRRITNTILDQVSGRNNGQLIIRLDRFAHTAESFLSRASHMLSLPSFNFSALVSKWSLAVYILVRFIAQILGVTAAAAFLAVLKLYLGRQAIDIYGALRTVFANPVYHIIILILTFVNARTVLFRMDDKEV